MGDPSIETFDEAKADWVPFDRDDPSPVVPLVRTVLDGTGPDAALVRIEGPAPAAGRRLFGRRRPGERPAAQVVGPRPGMPVVLTVGDETDEPVGHRFAQAGIVLPEGWSLAAPEGTFPWVDVPGRPEPEAVVRFVVDALARLGAAAGEWRAAIDRPRTDEHGHTHGPDGHHHHHGPGGHHHGHSH